VEAGMELRAQVEGVVPAKLREKGLEYDIRVRLQEGQRDLERDFKDILVPNQNRRLVHLTTVADPVKTTGPSSINRYNRSRFIQVTGQLATGTALGDVLKEGRKVMQSMSLPKGVTWEFVGQAEDLKDLIVSVVWAMGLALFFMYLILASLYESPVIPFTILLAVPLAIVGALAALWATGLPLDTFNMITIILLMGLVTKNSILLVDYILQARRRGLSRVEAIVDAGRIRLRPILMTTLALVAGMIPLVIVFTEVGRFRQSTGVAQIGGLVSSLFLTLLVVPAAYGYIDDIRLWFRKLFRLPPEEPEDKEAPAEKYEPDFKEVPH
jgi:hydrophobic/amphiphilic exporter-1 (mainly G- bacteria), HAE1 family